MLVESVMTRAVVTTEFSRSVQSAARLMRDGHFRHLPVVSCGRLVGIVSDRDVAAGGEGPSTRLEVCLNDPPRQLSEITALAYDVMCRSPAS
jgi:acetoin utilization protein AcuB